MTDYAQEIGTGRESLSLNSIKLENKLLLNKRIDKIANSTKIHSFFEQSCAILSSFKIMITFNESTADIKTELAYVVICYFSTVTVRIFIFSPTSSICAKAP